MNKWKGKYLSSLYKTPMVYSVILGVLFFVLSGFVIFIAAKIYQQQEMENMNAQMELVKSRINRTLKAVDIEAFNLALQLDDNGEINNLDSIGAIIIERNPYISGIEIVPHGVVRDVYPYEIHKEAIGLDVLALESAKKAAINAIKNKKLFYAGPLTLKQGGEAIIARLPIFENGKFWGFSAILIDLEGFLEEIKIYQKADNNIHIQFAYFNENIEAYEVWNKYEKDYTQKISYDFVDTNWRVTVFSKVKYSSYLVFIFFIIAGIIISILVAQLLFRMLKKPVELEEQLQQKTNELLIQNAYFSSLINAIPDFIFIVDKNGKILNFHSSNRDGLLDSPDRFIGKKLSDYFDADLTQRMIGKINFSIKEGELTSHTYSLSIKGKKEYFEARMVKINTKEALVFVRKISNIIESNYKLFHSETKYRQLVQKAPDFIFQTNDEGMLLSANIVGLRLTGFTETELKSMHINDVIHLHNGKGSSFKLLKNELKEPVNATLINKHGAHVAVEITASNMKNGGVLAIARDVTERNKYIDFIESQNKNLSEITWIQSHQVRAPLAKIMSLVNFIKSNYDNTDFNKEMVIKGMEESLGELDEIIRDIVHKSEVSVKEIWNEKKEGG